MSAEYSAVINENYIIVDENIYHHSTTLIRLQKYADKKKRGKCIRFHENCLLRALKLSSEKMNERNDGVKHKRHFVNIRIIE